MIIKRILEQQIEVAAIPESSRQMSMIMGRENSCSIMSRRPKIASTRVVLATLSKYSLCQNRESISKRRTTLRHPRSSRKMISLATQTIYVTKTFCKSLQGRRTNLSPGSFLLRCSKTIFNPRRATDQMNLSNLNHQIHPIIFQAMNFHQCPTCTSSRGPFILPHLMLCSKLKSGRHRYTAKGNKKFPSRGPRTSGRHNLSPSRNMVIKSRRRQQ